ncbi:hypothetical protein CDAR_221311 [Caerostris darwini]|uniref:Uncharacterized protein n=1 Tax=Caerostris darwini TaxID=1538125 RepID=A0AAV4WKY2_9ARAC|nr:hypothetical protein CDAR_221311 [Caerostris darwini]
MYGVAKIVPNSTVLPETVVSVNTSMAISTLGEIENTLELISALMIIILAVGFSIYFCCCEHTLVPTFRGMFGIRRQGRRNHHFNLPLPPLREVAASPCPTDQLPQEDRRVSRDETPDTRMEATDNIPMFEIHTMTTV